MTRGKEKDRTSKVTSAKSSRRLSGARERAYYVSCTLPAGRYIISISDKAHLSTIERIQALIQTGRLMVGRWSASSRQDIGSQRVTRAVCFMSSYTCRFMYMCAYSDASAHFNPLIAPHANRLNRMLLYTLHSIISVSSACSRTREVVGSARTRANEWKRK